MEPLAIATIGSLVCLAAQYVFGKKAPVEEEYQEKNTSFYDVTDNSRLNLTFKTNVSDSESDDEQKDQKKNNESNLSSSKQKSQRNKIQVFKNPTKREINQMKNLQSQKLLESRILNEGSDEDYEDWKKKLEKDSQHSGNKLDKTFHGMEDDLRHNNKQVDQSKNNNAELQNLERLSSSSFQRPHRVSVKMLKILAKKPENCQVLIQNEIQKSNKRREAIAFEGPKEQSVISSIKRNASFNQQSGSNI